VQPVFLFTFLEVLAWIVIVMFWTLFIWMFISVFADIFRRRDMSGFVKVIWVLAIFLLPLIGILIYMIVRPPMATYEQDMEIIQAQKRAIGYSPTEEIAKAKQLLDSGTISQAEFDQIKQRAMS
jgi:hypothetical protein